MNKLFYFLLFSLSTVPLLQSCHKDPPVSPPLATHSIPDELKAYWNFKPGTYWIYKDSICGAIDSVYVTGYKNYTGRGILNYTGDSIIYEALVLNTHSSLDGYDYDYSINTEDGLILFPNGNQVYCSKSNPNKYVDTHDCFVYPLSIGSHTTEAYGGGNDVDSCIIRNIYNIYKTYINVVEINNTFNSFENYSRTRSFYAKNIGLIRYEASYNHKIRTLITYHIN